MVETMLAAFAIGTLFSALEPALRGVIRRKRVGETVDQAEFRRRRIERLTATLADAELLIGEITADIHVNQRRAEDLERDLERKAALARVTPEQAAAVAALLDDTIRSGERRSFWTQFAVNASFFVLGVVASGVISLVSG